MNLPGKLCLCYVGENSINVGVNNFIGWWLVIIKVDVGFKGEVCSDGSDVLLNFLFC